MIKKSGIKKQNLTTYLNHKIIIFFFKFSEITLIIRPSLICCDDVFYDKSRASMRKLSWTSSFNDFCCNSVGKHRQPKASNKDRLTQKDTVIFPSNANRLT